MTKSDCIVVGGGLIGMLSAYMLAENGVTVTLLERGETARESSWAGGGILSPLYPWRYPQAVTDLAGWSQQYYPELVQQLRAETGVDPEWVQSGLLIPEVTEHKAATAWAQTNHIRLDVLDAAGLKQLAPGLGIDTGTALWLPQVAQIRNPRLAHALKKSLVIKGVEIIEGCEVHAINTEKGAITGVSSSQGAFSTEHVVVAGGAWSRQLLAPLGLLLNVEPVRGQMLLFAAEPGIVPRIILYNNHYLIPRQDGRVLAGSTLEYVGFDKSVTSDALAELHQAALAMVPALKHYPVEQHWAGLRPGTTDGVPYIGEHPDIKGLLVNTGHFRNGVVLAPASARLLSDLYTKQQPVTDPAPYAVIRN